LALLPREDADEQAEELRQLNVELAEYRRYQHAARELARLSSGRSSWERQAVARLAPDQRPLPELSLTRLAEAFQLALRRTEPAIKPGLIRAELSQETVMKQLRQKLRRGRVELQNMLDALQNRYEVIVTFLAVLELMKHGELRVVQEGQFGAIVMEPAHG
jgi:segregation and condensation protein A